MAQTDTLPGARSWGSTRWRGLAARLLRTRATVDGGPVPRTPVEEPGATTRTRPHPTLRWIDAERAPEGGFAATAIPNAALTAAHVPGPGASWDAVAEFCLSYDGSAYWTDLPELAKRAVRRWTRDGSVPVVLDELRACLFHEQRRWHHLGAEPDGRSRAYVWALVDAVRAARPAPAAAPDPDPRVAHASETHVTVVPAPAATLDAPAHPTADEMAAPDGVAAPSAPSVAPAAHRPRTPVPPAEEHVRLVALIEDDAAPAPMAIGSGRVVPLHADGGRSGQAVGAAASRHPAAYRTSRPAAVASLRTGGPERRGAGAARPGAAGEARATRANGAPRSSSPATSSTTAGAAAELRPMPMAEPLPKPSVIVPRSRRSSPPSSDGGERRRPTPPPRSTTAVAVFDADDAGYLAWLVAHTRGYVMSASRTRSDPPVLHHIRCPALRRVPGSKEKLTTALLKVCGPTLASLQSWSAAQGLESPIRCPRCHR